MANKNCAINIKNLTKIYDNGLTALDGVSLDVYDGEIFGIIGLSGAGKSTLVRCINLLEKPTSGSVLFYGRELTALSRNELLAARRKISMIFQSFNLFSQRNVFKNVAYPLELAGADKTQIAQRVNALLNLVGIADKAKVYPSQLSGGQQQRVAIARALASNPKVLLCDEATSALDGATTQTILQLLKKINAELGVTVVIITHELAVVESICHRVAVIDSSKIAEVAAVSQIFKNPQSAAAKQLILPKTSALPADDNKCIRILFDGETLTKPIVSSMAIELNVLVNIVFADTRTIEGKTYGQLVIQLPKDAAAVAKIAGFLQQNNVVFKEETLNA